MKEYCYVMVEIKGIDKLYCYISDDMGIKKGNYVAVPFGEDNEERAGRVESVLICTSKTAPYPVRKTKRIICKISRREYEEFEDDADLDEEIDNLYDMLQSKLGNLGDDVELGVEDDPEEDDAAKIKWYLKNVKNKKYDYNYLEQWALNHDDGEYKPGVNSSVLLQCYQLCAEKKMPVSCLQLGAMYYRGALVPQDYQKSKEFYQVAADAGLKEGIRNLGYCYYYGRGMKESDYEKAYECFDKGALLFRDAACLYKLGDMYRYGQKVEENPQYAFMLYMNALSSAEEDEDDMDLLKADVFRRVGECLVYGIGVDVDVERGYMFLQNALTGYYLRRRRDPFAKTLTEKTKKLIRAAEKLMNGDF